MGEYRIAFLTADWNYELVENTLHGAKRFVDDHPNVHLCIFDCFGKDQNSAGDRSEYAIYDLVDLSRFDGILVQGNQIVLRRVRDKLGRQIVRAGIPAVSIDCPVEGCTLVGIDNERAQYDMTAHVIQKHGARRLVYLTGIMDNGCPEGRQRRDGFLAACRDNGLRDEDIQVIECTWRTSDGNRVAGEWIAQNKPLPDAFICGNDEMALGMLETFGEHGCRVPQDVIVTGFDNIASAELSNPRLTTVSRDSFRLNYRALEVLLDRIEGREPGEKVNFEYDIIGSESCGCETESRQETVRGKYFHQTRFLKNFYNLQDQMAEGLFEASDLMDLMDIVEKNHGIFGCDNVYLCVNGYYFDNYDKKQWNHDSEAFGEEMILATCGRSDLPAADGKPYVRFPTSALLPGDMMDNHRFLVFYPLHYNTYSIGYVVLDGISEAAKLNLHKSILSFLEIGIENVRKKGLLRQFNDVLDNLYVHDALTGLYNRFGYDRYGQSTYDRFLAEDGGAQILFIDMDDMKGINDRYGHEMGDAAIRAAARALEIACGAHDFLMRYGGDEFLVIASRREAALEDDILRAVKNANAEGGMPFELSLSVGVIRAYDSDARTLEACVQAADTLMYENKNRRKGGE